MTTQETCMVIWVINMVLGSLQIRGEYVEGGLMTGATHVGEAFVGPFQEGLRKGVVGLFSSVEIAASSMAPANSMAATFGLIVAVAGFHSPATLMAAFLAIPLYRWRDSKFFTRQSIRTLIGADAGVEVTEAELGARSEVTMVMAAGETS